MEEIAGTNGICDALRDFVTFAQFKKREKRPWRSVTFSEVAKSLDFFHILKIVQLVPIRTKQHIWLSNTKSLKFNKW